MLTIFGKLILVACQFATVSSAAFGRAGTFGSRDDNLLRSNRKHRPTRTHTALKREPILIDLEQMNLPMNPPLADTVRVLSPVSLTGLQLINLSVGGLLRPLHSFLGCSKSVRNIIPDGLTSCGGRHETSGPIHFRIHVEQPKAYQSLKPNRPDLSF